MTQQRAVCSRCRGTSRRGVSGWVDVLGGGKSLIKATRCCCAASLGGCWSKGVFVGCVAVSMEKEEYLGAGRRSEPERGLLSPRRG